MPSANVLIPLSFGENSAVDELRLPLGWLRELRGWYYKPDDPDRPHKYFGRTLGAALPGAATAGNTKGITHLQYDTGTDKVVVATNSRFYEADAGTTLGAWATAKDAAAADYTRTQTFLKALMDGKDRSVLWDGDPAKQPLVRDADGNYRTLSMKQANAPDLNSVLSAAPSGNFRPNTAATASGASSPFLNPSRAYDTDTTTYALYVNSGIIGTFGSLWSFSGTPAGAPGVNTEAGSKVFIRFDVSTRVASGDVDPLSQNVPPLTTARLRIRANTGAGLVTVAEYPMGTPDTIFSFDASVVAWTSLQVEIVLIYNGGSLTVMPKIYDIWVTTGGLLTGSVTAGDYYYAVVEVWKNTLASGATIVERGAPSKALKVTVGASKTGVILTLGSLNNAPAQGYAAAKMFLEIYRSTASGGYPDLGFIGDVPGNATTFLDSFDPSTGGVSGETLGAISIRTVGFGRTFYSTDAEAPPIWDMTTYRGAFIAIPADNRRTIRYAMPGMPGAWPEIHNIAALPLDRNEEGIGIVSVGESILLFLRTRVMRLRNVAFANSPNFDPTVTTIDVLSPNEGLAGGPKAYCQFNTQDGAPAVAWVSDNGAWMTDGMLPSERGLGARKLTSHMDWPAEVSISGLSSAVFTYDPVIQSLLLDCTDPAGTRKTLVFSVAPAHWATLPGAQIVPKFAEAPSNMLANDRVVGENSGLLQHWSLNTTDLNVYLERNGADAAGEAIVSTFSIGWLYPAEPTGEWMLWRTLLYHTDWGQSDLLELEVLTRWDRRGIEQHSRKILSLRGAQVSRKQVGRSGQAIKIRGRHVGKTTSPGSTPLRAIGPIVLELTSHGIAEAS